MVSFFYLYIYYRNRKKLVWQEVKSSAEHKNEGIRRIVKNIAAVSIPISFASLLATTTKSIDAFTVVRILKSFMEEQTAITQYGILSGKVDILMNVPYSINIAFATALVPAVSYSIASKEEGLAKKRIEFSMLTTILIGLPCSLILFMFSKQLLEILFPNALSGNMLLSLSSIGIIFVVLLQTINGALQGLGKVGIRSNFFRIRGDCKINIK